MTVKRSPIRRVSKKRAAISKERAQFVGDLIATHPRCQIGSPVCSGGSTTVHEALKRSHGGAIVPGDKATRQGQNFFPCCRACNGYVEDHPSWAAEKGFVIRS